MKFGKAWNQGTVHHYLDGEIRWCWKHFGLGVYLDYDREGILERHWTWRFQFHIGPFRLEVSLERFLDRDGVIGGKRGQ